MLRAVLLGVLAISAAATGCGSKHDAPQVDPAAPAGTVVEVSGAVTVAAKPLAVGDTVKANDVIETGADGSVVIKLAHNDARWELGPGHKSKPSESPAWTLAKATGPAKNVEQDTSAAGRPAERSAADTSTSRGAAVEEKKEERARPTADSVAPPTAPPTTGAPVPAASQPAPPPPPPPPPPKIEAQPASPQAQPAPGGGEGAAKGAKMAVASTKSTATGLGALSSCLVKGQTVKIKLHVADHVPTITFVGDVDPKVKDCITKAAKGVKLPAESGDAEMSLTK